MTEFKKHTDKIATSILRGEYSDYDKNWWHYDREYNMLLKAQTEAFKLANEAAEQQDIEAIDTVVEWAEKPLPTDGQIKQSITEAVEKEKECIRQFLIDDGYELLADKI